VLPQKKLWPRRLRSDGAKLWFSSGDVRDSLAGRTGFEPPVPLTSALNFALVTDLVRNPADIGRVTSITVLSGIPRCMQIKPTQKRPEPALANEHRRRSLHRMTDTVDPGFNSAIDLLELINLERPYDRLGSACAFRVGQPPTGLVGELTIRGCVWITLWRRNRLFVA
jgi:hypothetical protein